MDARTAREPLEPFGPLSASTIWRDLSDVYARAGPDIWAKVPAAVTGNAFVGDRFAAALEAWLLDQGDAVDAREPVYVLELGAGSGMFSHAFVTAVARRRARGTFPHPHVVLVMCDQPGMRFDEWAEENILAKHVRSGVIDRATVAVRDDGNFAPIVLEHSRSTLASVTNPLVVVANYFFDSIPSDAFRVRDGQLFEARTRFVRARKTDTFKGLENEEQPIETGTTHYGNAALDAVLASYVHEYAEASLLMPIAGIRCIDALQELAGDRIFVLALDKGTTGHGRVAGWFNQPFVPHDEVFSYLVNFDAMRRWFEVKGGSALCTTHDDRSLVAFAGVLPGATATSSHLRRYFADHIDSVDAFNAFNAFAHGVHEVPKVAKSAAVAPLLDLLAQMRGDPDAFAAVIYRTIDVIAATETGVRSLALRLAQAAKENFYSPRFHNDVYYWSGRLHYALGDLDTAERDFDASLSIFGKRSHAHFFLGVIAERRGFAETALDHYARHRTVDAECQATKNAIRRVSGKLTATREQAPPAASR